MPFAVELVFDDISNQLVTQAWETLTAIAGSDYMIANGVHPHVAVAVAGGANAPTDIQTELAEIARLAESRELQHSGVGHFTTESPVVYLGFPRSEFLQTIHADVASVLAAHGIESHAYYQWDLWQPHCTLAMQFEASKLASVLSGTKELTWDAPFQVTGLAIVTFPPAQLAWSRHFGP